MKTILSSLFNQNRFLDAEAGTEGAAAGGGAVTTDTEVVEKDMSIRDTLNAAVELDEKGPEDNDLSEAARRLASARRGAPKVEDKVQVDKTKVETKVDAKVEDKTKTADTSAPVEAPAHWPAADRELFAKQAPEVKKWLLDRHKAMETDYMKKTSDLAGTKRLSESLDEIFKPFDDDMRLQGITREQAIRELVGIHARMKKDPREGLKYLAGLSRIDLKELIEGGAAADPAGESPTVKALRNELAELKQWKTTFTAGQATQQQTALMSEITQFAEAKDDQGNPKHPHFDDVAPEVARLIRASKLAGEQITLQVAYDQAVYANPTTRAKLLSAQEAERRAKEEAERKAKVDSAQKAAAGNVQGAGAAAVVAAKTDSVRGDLEAAFASHGGRV